MDKIIYRYLYSMLGLCPQSLYYLLLTIIAEVCGLLIIGYDKWVDYFKNNYWISIGGILIYLVIIQTLCYFNKNTMAWILFWITFVLNIISLLTAFGQKMQDTQTVTPSANREEKTEKTEKTEEKSVFNRSANTSCKSSCIETCDKNPNKPHDFDCNSYCDNACDKMF